MYSSCPIFLYPIRCNTESHRGNFDVVQTFIQLIEIQTKNCKNCKNLKFKMWKHWAMENNIFLISTTSQAHGTQASHCARLNVDSNCRGHSELHLKRKKALANVLLVWGMKCANPAVGNRGHGFDFSIFRCAYPNIWLHQWHVLNLCTMSTPQHVNFLWAWNTKAWWRHRKCWNRLFNLQHVTSACKLIAKS